MKKIENKKVSVKGKETCYAEIIVLCNEAVPEKGWTAKTMAQAVKIDGVMTSDKGLEVIELEDADCDYIKQLVGGFNWAIKDPAIVEFIKYIATL